MARRQPGIAHHLCALRLSGRPFRPQGKEDGRVAIEGRQAPRLAARRLWRDGRGSEEVAGILRFVTDRQAFSGFRRRRPPVRSGPRSEEHTSELQSLMRNSYAVFCLKNKKTKT